MTLYATTTPKGFFDHVNERFLADGMYARLNLMVAEKPEMGHLPLEPRVPQDIIEQARLWAHFRPEGSGNMGPKAMLAPYTADAEPLAEALFRKQQERLLEMHRTDAPEWKCYVPGSTTGTDPPHTASGISTCAAQVYPTLAALPACFQPDRKSNV